ncbi:unnamed protein product [Kuraishia capsulata CBS 1993]|uniref:DNA-binding protein REB1 n=1 Tax=Kuraishia capsulata CBS 1993 TaxID=1382522 RepID=W6MWK9_9ASCO|nr:uncharacterized protein KUCA_T00003568001 [Kuraishia capsulata CBS 1993]CDK27590.1 unnamed protein product [Kuraishia capsulata CBS 1993]
MAKSEHQQELGGAQALLELGTKNKEAGSRKDDDRDQSQAQSQSQAQQPQQSQQSQQHQEPQQQSHQANLNEAVEDAVLKYVGSTLDADSSNNGNVSKKRKVFTTDDISNMEFQQWTTGFLADDLHDGNEDDFTFNPDLKKIKAKRDFKKQSSSAQGSGLNVDPELTHLGSSEHDQLVQAAMRDARALSVLGHLDADYLRHVGSDDVDDSNEQLAAQAVARAAGVKADSGNHSLAEAAALVEAAATKASSWVTTSPQTKIFSKEETDAIKSFVKDYCQIHGISENDVCRRVWSNERKKDGFWEALQKVLPLRSRASLYKHVRRAYNVFDLRGRWGPEDDAALGRLASEKEGQWKQIGLELGRMPEDCRDRWRNYVKCGKQRNSDKWTDEEEERLKSVIHQLLTEGSQDSVINWTMVSEKMGGTRSRIQCRYKWNKLLRREAAVRAKGIDINDRLWLLTRMKQELESGSEEIPWETLASMHDAQTWTATDFKVCFEIMRSSIRDFRRKSQAEILDLLLQDLSNDIQHQAKIADALGGDQHQDGAFDESKVKPQHPTEKQLEAVAVAAVQGTDDYIWK